MEQQQVDPKFGCKHYSRRCQKKCNECQEFHCCRLCHDEVHYHSMLDPKKNHQFNRYNVTEIKCNNCGCIQPPQQNCQECNIEFASYFCSICNLFDNNGDEKQIYHCDKCGICRVGGKDKSYHCDVCECCLPLNAKDSHVCVPGQLKQNCAICFQDMQSSISSISLLRCGHAMHSKCIQEYLESRNSIACPICRKSLCDPTLFEDHFDRQIAETPMPDEYKNSKMNILCNDCLQKSEVPFHVVGGKCSYCRSYNTQRISTNEAQA